MTDKTRDELIRQVAAMGHTQQQLIERLAQMVLDARASREKYHTLYLDVQGYWLDASCWAKAWKAIAKFNRKGWLKALVNLAWHPWHCRRDGEMDMLDRFADYLRTT